MDSVETADLSDRDRAAPPPVTYVCPQPGTHCDLSRTLMRTLGHVALTGSLREIEDRAPTTLTVIHYDTLSAGERR